GRWHCVIMVVAPMNDRFHPNPSSASPLQKCATVMPEMPTMVVAAISAKPMPVIGSTPKRAIKEPVIKLGAYIATMALSQFPQMQSMAYLLVTIRDNLRDNSTPPSPPLYRKLVTILVIISKRIAYQGLERKYLPRLPSRITKVLADDCL